MALACISVDLDSLPHYSRIHGLPAPGQAPATDLVYETAVARFGELFEALGLTATYFAIGEALDAPAAQASIRSAHRAGFEIGSHSHRHDYALSRLPAAEIAVDLKLADDAIARAIGERPVGFRAPGYTLSPALYQAVCSLGYRYDSSTFPALPYYLAKATVMGALRLLGRPSRAVLDHPSVLAAPRGPYLPDPERPYRAGAGPVLEMPIATGPVSRVPFIGTLAAALPSGLVRPLYRTLRGEPLLNFELHGIDVLGEGDGIAIDLVRQQRDLAVPWKTKVERLREVFSWIRGDFEVVTLAQAALRVDVVAKTGDPSRGPPLGIGTQRP